MSKEFSARHLDVKSFAEHGAALSGKEPLQTLARLRAETRERDDAPPVVWTASGELRNPGHVHPEIWLHLKAQAVLGLTCQRCLGPVDVPVVAERSFRFVADEDMAAVEDEQSEEDVLALSRSFDLVELVEDELLMELPLSPRHESCPVPVKSTAGEEDFAAATAQRENPFSMLGKFKAGKS